MSRLKSRKTQQIELWKVIPDYPDYEVSSLGRVRRSIYSTLYGKKTYPGKILSLTINKKNGYIFIALPKAERNWLKRRYLGVHRLVLENFVGSCPEGHEPNHKNKNRSDNKLINLEWITTLKNRSHKGEKNGASVYNQKQAIHARWLCRLNFTCKEIAKVVGCSPHLVGRIRYKFKWSHA